MKEESEINKEYQISGNSEQTYDDVVELASEICETPIALVSLINNDRFWFKSKTGLEIEEVPQSMAFCTYGIQHPNEIFIVKDAANDSRFADNPFVTGDLKIRFYAGAPLVSTGGEAFGMLCVLDYQERELSEKQKLFLRVLAKQVVAQLEMQQMIQEMHKIETRRKEVEAALRESDARFKAFMKNSPAVAYMKDKTGKYVYINRLLETIFQVTEDELIGKDDFFLLPHHVANYVRGNDAAVLVKGQSMELLEETETNEGIKTHWLSFKFPFNDNNGELFLGGVSVDITARKTAEEKLNESERRYRNLFELSPGYISVHDTNGIIISMNEAAANALGYQADDLIGKNLTDFLTPESKPSFIKQMQSTGEDSRHEGVINVLTKDGETRTWQYRNRIYQEKDGTRNFIGYAQDITELKRIEKKLQDLTLRDELTALYNRRGYFTLAEQALRYARRKNKNCTVIYADLDNLKSINDKFGHTTGSQMIIETANIFKAFFRDSDIIARFGGDEFVILVQDSSENGVEAIRERLQKQIEEFNDSKSKPFSISISFGFASFDPKSDATVEDLISEADQLMYSQKQQKKFSSSKN